MTKVGGGRQYLVIDLATEQWEVRLISGSTFGKLLGGEALGLYLWSQHVDSTKLVEDEPICFTLGALCGSSAICSSTLSIVGRSPASRLVESATTVSSFSHSMVSCGWQGILMHGVSRRQMTLHITSDAVEFRPSDKLIGKSTGETSAQLKENQSSSIICIGPAGEQGVSYATLVSDAIALDRFGFGAAMGKKHIKALVLSRGSVDYSPFNEQDFDEASAKIRGVLDKSRYVKTFAQSGPLYLLDGARKKGFAAVDGLTKRTDPRMFHLGEGECARKFALEVTSSNESALCCKRYVMRPGGQDTILPDAWEMMALGSNIGNYDPALVMQWRSQCIELGLDPIATGIVIGSVMTAYQHGDSMDLPELTFGEVDKIANMIDMIGRQVGQGPVLVTGGKESQVYGREISPFDPRGAWGQALLTGLREDFPLVPELVFAWLPATSMRAKAEWVVIQENFLAMLRSVGMCEDLMIPLLFEGRGSRLKSLFLTYLARFPSKAKQVMDFSSIAALVSHFTGVQVTNKTILDVGRRAVLLKRQINGNDAYPAMIPERFLIDPESNHEQSNTIPYKQLAARYRLLRTLDLGAIGEE